MKRKELLLFSLSLFTAFSFCVASYAWFVSSIPAMDDEQVIDGELGLRTYFYDGNGTEEHPYEIVLPIHFYNLSRLQNLGVFQNKKFYFQVGHDFNGNGQYYVIESYNSDGTPVLSKTLDMATICESSKILAVGGEGAPFIGDFDGKNITIKNLTVTGYPEDIGLFGYIACDGNVSNIVAKNLIINSAGYSNTNTFNDLFGTDVDDVLNEAVQNCFSDANLYLYDYNSNQIALRNDNGVKGFTRTNINSSDNSYHTNDEVPVYYSNLYFKPQFPSDSRFTYSMRFSTNALEEGEDENGDKIAKINLTTLKENTDFNQQIAEIDSRIYLVANVTINGYTYSRVVQTYLCQFFSNAESSTFDDGNYSVKIYCDYVAPADATYKSTNYKHGNNVGYLAGHVDGNITNCFVYNATFNLNQSDNMVPLLTESDTGLIGEIGINVENHVDPDFGLTTNGDTGVMNFSGIYEMVRGDVTVGDKVFGSLGYELSNGTNNMHKYIAYNRYLNTTSRTVNDTTKPSWEFYKDYLRHDDNVNDSDKHYIVKISDSSTISAVNQNYSIQSSYASSLNRIDFKPNTVISDTTEINRGMGVFKLATAKSDNNPVGYLDGINKCVIINGKPIDKVYFSTAEINLEKYKNYVWYEVDYKNATNHLENVSTLPSHVSYETFNSLYERDFDYVFEMDLTKSYITGQNNFFYNTDSPFLQSYLYYKLVGKNNQRINPGEQQFGFMLRTSDYESISSLSSYMPVYSPTAKFAYTESDGTIKYYPQNTITFRIESECANVSVISTGDANTRIFKYDPTSSEIGDITPAYEMFSMAKNRTSAGNADPTAYDNLKYYKYYPENDGETTTVVETPEEATDALSREGKAYAHIFKLDKGDYCIGSSSTSLSSNIYFLAVQGQTDSNIGNTVTPTLGNAIADVDFYLTDPEVILTDRQRAVFSFRAYFNNRNGTFSVLTTTDNKIKIVFLANQNYVDSVHAVNANETSTLFLVNETNPTNADLDETYQGTYDYKGDN